jgi:6-phosphogluconolactonase (cycloisomerase 2 family)
VGSSPAISRAGTSNRASDTESRGPFADRRVPDRGTRRAVAALSLAALVLLVVAGTALAITGQLTQLPGTAGCISETGRSFPEGPPGVCTNGRALNYTASVAISRDGENVYAAASQSDAVVVFARNATTGELTQLPGTAGCISETGSNVPGGPPGVCADGKGLNGAFGVVVSGDGNNVYVTSTDPDDAVAAFRRNTTTGALTQLAGTAGCISDTGTTFFGETCADGRALDKPRFLAISGDSKHVYVPTQLPHAVVVFARNPTTGALTQLAGTAGCVSASGAGEGCATARGLDNPFQLTVSPDGRSVYVVSLEGDSVVAFRRNPTTGVLTQPAGTAGCVSETGSGGDCADGKALDRPFAVAVSRDGEHAYISSVKSDAVAAFDRNTTTGKLTQLAGIAGCVSETGTGGACADGRALIDVDSVTVSPDGRNVYLAAGYETYAVAVFARDTTSGAITQLPGTAGCIQQEGGLGEGCAPGEGLQGAYYVIVSPGGKNFYLASVQSDAVSVFTRETPP